MRESIEKFAEFIYCENRIAKNKQETKNYENA